MGSSQSSPSNSTTRLNVQDITTIHDNGGSDSDTSGTPPPLPPQSSSSSKKKNLKGIALVEHKCRKKKRRWNQCVSAHYKTKFLPGKSLEPEEDCDDFFESFRECYMKGLLKERQRKGLPDPKEGTMLHEFMEEEGIETTTTNTTTSNDDKR
mmetsp:Transcript_48523/g.117370  ORF Transcript_48523/g.117370 Transcript_48523/m.117370 type:complete len:152 (+) Transcript_48523:86-541(+)